MPLPTPTHLASTPHEHVLLLNPNTRADLTANLAAQLQAMGLGQGAVRLMTATPTQGVDYIASEVACVTAAAAALAAWQDHVRLHGAPKAILLACFGDPGVWALREAAGVPVMGLAEASFIEASPHGPFGVVTGGHAWRPMLERLARSVGVWGDEALCRIDTVDAAGGQLLADPERGREALLKACLHSLHGPAPVVPTRLVLGGAALGGWARDLQPRVPVPVIDSVEAGGRWLARQA